MSVLNCKGRKKKVLEITAHNKINFRVEANPNPPSCASSKSIICFFFCIFYYFSLTKKKLNEF